MTKLEKSEVVSVLENYINKFWLLMGGTWMLGFKWIPTLFAGLAVITALLIAIYSPKSPAISLSQLIFGCSWIGLDISWMLNEFYEIEWLYTCSWVMFVLAVSSMICGDILNQEERNLTAKAFIHFRKFMIKTR